MKKAERRPCDDPKPATINYMLGELLKPIPWWSLNKKKIMRDRELFVQEISEAYGSEYARLRTVERLVTLLDELGDQVYKLLGNLARLNAMDRAEKEEILQ